MKVCNIYYHPRFKKSFSDIPKNIQVKTDKRVKMFRQNVFTSSLKTHKLHGKLKDQWSFYVDNQYRILFIFDDKDVIFLDIGSRDIYK